MNERAGRLRRGDRSWSRALVVAGALVGGVTSGLASYTAGDGGSRRVDAAMSAEELTLGAMDRHGNMDSRDIAWRLHVMRVLDEGVERHATLTVAKQRANITEQERYVISFANAPDMVDPFRSLPMSEVSIQIREVNNPEVVKTLRLHETLFKDSKRGYVKSSWETETDFEPGVRYEFSVICVDQDLGKVDAFLFDDKQHNTGSTSKTGFFITTS